MLVVCASKLLKKPIEFDISEEKYKEITNLSTPAKQQSEIAKLAMEHVRKYGYDLGRCTDTKRGVDLMTCSQCGINKGENKVSWEACKRKNLEYKYPVNRQSVLNSTKRIKDPKIRSALELTKEEMTIANQLYLRD